MTQQFVSPIGRAIGTAQGLQGIQMGAMQNQNMATQMAVQQQEREQAALAAKQQQEKLARLEQLQRQYMDAGDTDTRAATMNEIFLTDPDTATALREQLSLTSEEDNQRAMREVAAIKTMLDSDPVAAQQWFMRNAENLHPSLRGLAQEFEDGDFEEVRNQLGVGVTLAGGIEAYNELFGKGEKAKIGTYNPRDYTVESFARFNQTGDPSVLQRYESARTVDIGGVPHVFSPATQMFTPGMISESGEFVPTGAPIEPPTEDRQARTLTAPMVEQPQARPVTAEDIAASRSLIVGAESAARVPAQLEAQGLRVNPETGEQEVIPGSKIDRDLQKANESEDANIEMQARSGRTLIEDLGRGMQMIEEKPFASGAFASYVPRPLNRQARNLQSMVDSIESNVSVNSLNEMRAASPTGGALGNVSDKQSALLAGLLGNLDITQNPEVLKDNMARIQNIFMDIVHGVGNGPERNRLSFDETGRRTDGGRAWQSTPEVLRLQAESQQGVGQRSPSMSREEADELINNILGGQ